MEKAVVLLSGGIGSTVAAAIAREQYAPALLHINWGHRTADREQAAFEAVAAAMRVERTLVADLSWMGAWGGCARNSKKLSIEDARALGRNTPTTFMLGLLPTMLSVAATWAGTIGAKRIFVGIAENHDTGGPAVSELYPDHRREFIQTMNLMLQYARPASRELVVEAPLLELTRAEVVRLGDQMKAPFEKTWSCYANSDRPCGRCRPCVTRATGFLKAGMPDPLLIEREPAGARG